MANNAVVGILRALLTVDTAQFESGFKKSTQTVEHFTKSLVKAGDTSALKRALSDFGGSRLIRDANNAVTAVSRLGGAAKLTAVEQQRLNATLQQAVEKYRLLGIEAPRAMQELERATRAASAGGAGLAKTMTLAATAGTFLGHALYDLGRNALRLVVDQFKDAVRLSAEASNAFLGLGSVAVATGTDINEAREAAQALAADGLMKVSESALGLKNLLASGFNLAESVRLMHAFKDSAAFGRQAALSFGHAVTSATEGIKNQNSILVDNAGVTKNLSVILREAGFSAQDLGRVSTDVRVRMALFNGILKETAAQTGDAERLTQTYTGAVSRLSTQYEFALANLGAAITQNRTVSEAIRMAADAVQDFNTSLTNQGRAFDLVSDTVVGFVRALSTLVTAANYVAQAFMYASTFIQSFALGFVQAGQAVQNFYLTYLKTIQALPGGSKAFIGLNETIEKLQKNYDLTSSLAFQFGRAVDDSGRKQQAFSDTTRDLASRLDRAADALAKTRGQTVEIGSAAAGARRPIAALGDTAGASAEQIRDLRDELTGLADIKDADTLLKAINGLDIRSLAAEEQLRINKTMESAIEAYRRLGRQVPQEIRRAFEASAISILDATALSGAMIGAGGQLLPSDTQRRDELRATLDADRELNEALGRVADTWERLDLGALTETDEERGLRARNVQRELNDGLLRWAAAGRDQQSAVERFGQEAASAAEVLLRFSDAIVDVAGAFGRMQQSIASGAIQGAQTGGSFVPGWGHMVGAGFGALAGFLTAQDAERRQQRAFRQQAFDISNEFMGVTTLQQQLEVGGNRAAQVAFLVRDAYLETGDSAERAARDLDRLFGDANASAREMERSLTRINNAFDRQALLADAQRERQELLNEAVERYGFTLEEAGRAFQSQTLAQQAERLIEDFQLLTESGADVEVVAMRMAEAVNAFVQQAVRTGTEVPEAMRPLLEALIQQGLLVDESGRAFQHLADTGIRFGVQLESFFENVLTRLDELIRRLTADWLSLGQARDSVEGRGKRGTSVQSAGAAAVAVVGVTKLRSGGFISKDDVPAVLHVGEGVTNAFATSLLGGKRGIDALNAGDLQGMFAAMPIRDPFSGMDAAIGGVSAPLFSSVATEAAARGGVLGPAGTTSGIRSAEPGESIHVHNTFHVSALASVDEHLVETRITPMILKSIERNRGGGRTKLRKMVREP